MMTAGIILMAATGQPFLIGVFLPLVMLALGSAVMLPGQPGKSDTDGGAN